MTAGTSDNGVARRLAEEAVMEKFGVTPDKMIDLQALIGDSVDNVPGVPGIGPKRASELITQYGTVEAVLMAFDRAKAKERDAAITALGDRVWWPSKP